jgi:type 1 glutamine amidotransferase
VKTLPAAILFTGGVVHPFESAAPTLADILREAGFEVRLSYDLVEILTWLQASPTALLVVYALRWSMTQHEKYAPDRPRWSLQLSAAGREIIAGHVERGGGLLGVHTASICFDDWPQWSEVLGGAWHWGQSHHPPLGPVRAHVDTHHFLGGKTADFSVSDEVYSDLRLAPGIEVFGWAKPAADASPEPGQPALWTHHYGSGRVVYDSLGHDADSLRQPVHQQLLQRAASWAAGISPYARGTDSCAV